MRVCLVDLAGAFGPLNSYLDLVEPLSKLGWSHTFVVPSEVESVLAQRTPRARVHSVSIGKPFRRDREVAHAVRMAVEGGAGVVHANTTTAARGAAVAALTCHRLPLVVHLRNSALSLGERVFLKTLWYAPLRVRMVAVSQFAASVAGAPMSAGAQVIPDAVIAPPARALAPLGRPARVGVVANWMPTKGFDVFVDVVAATIELDVRFEVFGSAGMIDSPSALVQDGRRKLADLDLEHRVRFHGVVPGLADEYAKLDVMLVTSRRESFSRIAAEALLAGVPLVAPRIPGLGETLRDGQFAELFDVGDAAGAALALERVLSAYTCALEQAAAAREWAAVAFDPERVAHDLDQVYRSAMRDNSTRR